MASIARQAFVGLGGNLGDRVATLRAAIDRIRGVHGVTFVQVSAAYETEPVGLLEQPRFLNAVMGLETTLLPEPLLSGLQAIEHAFGRERTVRWGPRTLDLDLLAFEGQTRGTPVLTLPHPRMLERAFVVVPLREVLQQPRFSRPSWDALREQVRVTLPEEEGVKWHAAL
jgi:2-amino-4-hydroxy-6-hydroxymethyldihydropteridine diphosphokinase